MKILKNLLTLIAACLLIFITIVLVRAFDARDLPDLKPWHKLALASEYRTDFSHIVDFDDYLKLEENLFSELDQRLTASMNKNSDDSYNRYRTNSLLKYEKYNRSYELIPNKPIGSVLLMHGLTDSPYSMRASADILYDLGYHVLVPRMPGHGTIPSALTTAKWHDWLSVLRLGINHLQDAGGKDRPFYLGGYSVGGALSVLHTLKALQDDTLVKPDKLILLSPAIDVSSFGVFAGIHKLISNIPYFNKFAWLDIYPEFDPYKYNSFPKHAGLQSYKLAKAIKNKAKQVEKQGLFSQFPNVITFQSIIDSTVKSEAIINVIYNHLPADKGEIVIYDINQFDAIRPFFKSKFSNISSQFKTIDDLPYKVTLIENQSPVELSVVARQYPKRVSNTTEYLSQSWPKNTYSLSHVAIPFPRDDPLYGLSSVANRNGSIQLGSLNPRGEKDVLTMPMKNFMRIRYNPFFKYQKRRLIKFIDSRD